MQKDPTPSTSSATGPAEGLDPAASLLDALEAYAPAPTLDTERNRRRRRQAIAGAMAEVLKHLAEDIRKERRAEAGAAEVRLAQSLERIHTRLEAIGERIDSVEAGQLRARLAIQVGDAPPAEPSVVAYVQPDGTITPVVPPEMQGLPERVEDLEGRLKGPAAMHQRRIEQLEERAEELEKLGAKYLATERLVEDIGRRTATINTDTVGELARRVHELEALHELDDEHATTAESLKEHRREVIQGVAKLVDRLRALEEHVGDRHVGETVQLELEATVAPSTEALCQRVQALEAANLGNRVAELERRNPPPDETGTPVGLALLERVRALEDLDAAMSERITELEDRPPVAVLSHEQHRDLAGALDELVGQRLKDNAARLEKLEEKAATPAPHGLGLAEHLETMGTQINRAHARLTSIEAQGRVDDLTLRVLALEGDSAEAHLTPGAAPAWRTELEARVEQLEQRRQHLEIRGEGWDAQLRAFLDASRDHTEAGAEMLTRVQALEHRVAELGHAPEPTPAPEPMPSPPGGIPSIILRACRGEDGDGTPAAAELSKLATLIGALWRPAQAVEAQAFREQAELVVRELLAAVRKLHPTREEGTAYLDAQVHAHLEAAHRPLLARLEELATHVRELEEQLGERVGMTEHRLDINVPEELKHLVAQLERIETELRNLWREHERRRPGLEADAMAAGLRDAYAKIPANPGVPLSPDDPLAKEVAAARGADHHHHLVEITPDLAVAIVEADAIAQHEGVLPGAAEAKAPADAAPAQAWGQLVAHANVIDACRRLHQATPAAASKLAELGIRDTAPAPPGPPVWPLAFSAVQLPKEERVPWTEGERVYWRHDLGRYSIDAGQHREGALAPAPPLPILAGTVLTSVPASAGRAVIVLDPGFNPPPVGLDGVTPAPCTCGADAAGRDHLETCASLDPERAGGGS